jgi:hypothetical protein
MHHKVVRVIIGEDFPEPLEGPSGRRIRCDIEMHEPSTPHVHQDEDVEHPKGHGHRHAEVAREQHLGMVSHEGAPPL